MTKKSPHTPDQKNPITLQSRLLGKTIKLKDDPEIYEVLGLKGRTKQVVLQVPSTERIYTISEDEFLALATEVEA